MQYLLLVRISNGDFTMPEVTANSLRQAVIGIAMFLFYIGVTVVFIQWFRRAYYNLHTISKDLSFSEGWAAGAWFVPFMNLGRPFVIMKEMMFVAESLLIKANYVTEKDARRRSVGIWWTLWIVFSIATNINNQIQSKSENLNVIINSSLASIVLTLMIIPLTFVTVRMIKFYTELEEHLPKLQTGDRPFNLDDSDLLDTI